MEDLNLNKCTICIEDILTDIEYLPCAHSFHKECIDEWIKTNNTCPICKIPIYIDSPEHLKLYNYYKNIEDEEKKAENLFFQQLSSGLFDQSISNLNIDEPSVRLNSNNYNIPAINIQPYTVYSGTFGLSESELDNDQKIQSENQSSDISIDNLDQQNDSDSSSINIPIAPLTLNSDNLEIFNILLNALASSSINIDYLNITNNEESDDDVEDS